MRKKRIAGLFLLGLLFIGIAGQVFAASSYSWNVKAKNVDAVYYGKTGLSEGKGIFPDTITYYAHIGGTQKSKITSYNYATLRISKPSGSVKVNEKVYYGHGISTSQKTVYADYVITAWKFDGQVDSGISGK